MHIITGLNVGGAEMMLYKLLTHLDRSQYEPTVVSLMDVGPVGLKIEAMGIPVMALGMRRGVPSFGHFLRLRRWIRQVGPDVVQTWMYHADLLGGLAAKVTGKVPVVWGIHHSNLDPARNKRSTLMVARLCAWLSVVLPERITCCSEASRRVHSALGYTAGKMTVIPNGFDVAQFRPNKDAGPSLRAELGLAADAKLIGLIARFDRLKDHRNLVQAAYHLSQLMPDVHYILCGSGVTYENLELLSWIDEVNLRNRFHLLGPRTDVPEIMAAMNLVTLSSSGEGFPNVIGEAMACGTPCVVTDVGDSGYMVGDTGLVVPPRDSAALANAWHTILTLSDSKRTSLGAKARERVLSLFEIRRVSSLYAEVYDSMVRKD